MSDLNAKHFMKHTVFVITILSLSLFFLGSKSMESPRRNATMMKQLNVKDGEKVPQKLHYFLLTFPLKNSKHFTDFCPH